MPSRTKTYCINGCKTKCDTGSRLCKQCQKDKRKARYDLEGSARDMGYDEQWSKVSKMVRRQEPICRICENALAQMVDHIIPLKQGGERLALSNLQPLCHKCHSHKTKEDIARYSH